MAGRGTGYDVPDGLQELLIEFTVSVLVEQPGDLYSYAAEYFKRLQEDKKTVKLPRDEETASEDDLDSPMEG